MTTYSDSIKPRGYRAIAEFLSREVYRADSKPGTKFHTRSEIATRFRVAPQTAERALEYLAENRVIERGRGKRAVILNATQRMIPGTVRPCKIHIVTPCAALVATHFGFAWSIHYIRSRIVADGNFLAEFDGADAVIILAEPAAVPDVIEKTLVRKIPYVCMSNSYPGKNTVYLDFGCALASAAQYLIRREISTLYFIRGADPQHDFLFRCHGLTFPEFLRENNFRGSLVYPNPVVPSNDADMLALYSSLSDAAACDKIGIVTFSDLIANELQGFLSKESSERRNRMELIGINYPGDQCKAPPYSFFDVNFRHVAERCLGLLYHQINTGRYETPGEYYCPSFQI